jgi:hypothetical protein
MYFVRHQSDFQCALDELRQREFDEGRYYPAVLMPPTPVDECSPHGAGRIHETIEEAIEAAGATGTRSILDIEIVSDEGGVGIARRLSQKDLEAYFETTTPTRRQVLENLPTNHMDRGEALCLPIYDEKGRPEAIFFAGYSCD